MAGPTHVLGWSHQWLGVAPVDGLRRQRCHMHANTLGWAPPSAPDEEQEELLEHKMLLCDPLQQRRLLEHSEDQAGAMAAYLSGT